MMGCFYGHWQWNREQQIGDTLVNIEIAALERAINIIDKELSPPHGLVQLVHDDRNTAYSIVLFLYGFNRLAHFVIKRAIKSLFNFS